MLGPPTSWNADIDNYDEDDVEDEVSDSEPIPESQGSVSREGTSPQNELHPYKLGEGQAVVPDWVERAAQSTATATVSMHRASSDDRGDVKLWSPTHQQGVDAFLASAVRRGLLSDDRDRELGANVECALETWAAFGTASGVGDAINALKASLAAGATARLSTSEVERLGQTLQRCGNNFRAVMTAMTPSTTSAVAPPRICHGENGEGDEDEADQSEPAANTAPPPNAAQLAVAGGEAGASAPHSLRQLNSLVEAYYLHHYVPMGFVQDEMRFAPIAALRQRRASDHKPRRSAVSEGVPKSLIEMLASGIVAPGEHVLSTAVREGRGEASLFADLLPSGLIRFIPHEGAPAQLHKTPAMFVRAAAGTCSNGWRQVLYDGVPLELLRDAAFDEQAALEAVALQHSISLGGGAPRPPNGHNLKPAAPMPRGRSVPATPAKRALGLSASKRPANAPPLTTSAPPPTTEPDLLSVACEHCGGSDDDEHMLLCDGCGGGFHLYCLRPPLSEVPKVAEWFCAGCTAHGFRPADEETSASPTLFEVDAILKKRQSIAGSEPEYLIRWQGFPPSHDSWEPRSGLLHHCKGLLDAFDGAKLPPRASSHRDKDPKEGHHKRKREAGSGGGGGGASSSAAAGLSAIWTPSCAAHGSTGSAAALGAAAAFGAAAGSMPIHGCASAEGHGGSEGMGPAPGKGEPPALGSAPPPLPSPPPLHVAEHRLESEQCVCGFGCSLQPAVDTGLAPAGESVLSYCFRDVLCFADLEPSGGIRTLGSDGTTLQLAAPCLFTRLVHQRVLGEAAAAALPHKHPHRGIHYKGVRVDRLRIAPRRPRSHTR